MTIFKIFVYYCCILLTACQQHTPLPPLMLWAWQAPQDLRGLDATKIGVATYIGTITITGNNVTTQANQARMLIPNNLYRMAVIHISVSPFMKPALDQNTIIKVSNDILLLYRNTNMPALQLDFSATNSQRNFYAEVIRNVHQQIDPNTYFSITALASWCVGDRWIKEQHLPIDLVVPMYFSLAQTSREKFKFIQSFPTNINSLAPECRNAIGIATFETWQVPLHADIPVFVFTRGSWTAEKIQRVFMLLHKIRC